MMLLLLCCCISGPQEKETSAQKEEAPLIQNNLQEKVNAVNQRFCGNIPTELILGYHPDGKRIEVEKVERSGSLTQCTIKLFHGDREYDFWEGHLSAWKANTDKPFWQYNPERNPAMYHKVTEFGDQAVYLAGPRQLMIFEDGIVYSVVPPSSGSISSSGKEIKELALEMARHYKL